MSAAAALALGFSVATGPLPVTDATFPGDLDGPPALAWQRRLPGPRMPAATHTELGPPVLAGGRIYVGSAADDALLVLDRGDGRLLQRLPAAGPVQSAAVIQGDRAWFSDTAGATSCYRLSDGLLLWRHEGSGPILASPLLHDGRLYVANLDHVVTALDADDGAFLWRHQQRVERPLSGPELYGAPTPTLVRLGEQQALLAGFADGTVVALGAERGDAIWQRRVGEGTYPDVIGAALDLGPTVVAGGFSGPLLALDPENRAVKWRVEIGSAEAPVAGPIDAATGLPVLVHGGIDGKLRSIDARTGQLRWTWDSETQGALTRPVWTDAGLLVGSSSGGLYLVDPVQGALRWTLDPGYVLAGVSAEPAVDGRQVVVVTNAGRILSLVMPLPEPTWTQGDGDFARVGGAPDGAEGADGR